MTKISDLELEALQSGDFVPFVRPGTPNLNRRADAGQVLGQIAGAQAQADAAVLQAQAATTKINAFLLNARSVREFGAVGDGLTNDRTACQAGIDWSRDTGHVLVFPSGFTFRLNSPLTLRSNARLQLEAGTRIMRAYSQNGAVGLFQAQSGGCDNFYMFGEGAITTLDEPNLQGNVFLGEFRDSLFHGFRIEGWGEFGRAFMVRGTRTRWINIYAVSTQGGGGLRFQSGTDCLMMGLRIDCGDDPFQCTRDVDTPGSNLDTRRITWLGCHGRAFGTGRLAVVTPGGAGTGVTEDVAFIGLTGSAIGGMQVRNGSAAPVRRISFIDCVADHAGYSATGAHNRIASNPGAGIRDVVYYNCANLSPQTWVFELDGPVENVVVENSYIQGPSATFDPPVRLRGDGVKRLYFRGTRFDLNPASTIEAISWVGPQVNDQVELYRCEFNNIASNQAAVVVGRGTGFRASENIFRRAPGATNTTGIVAQDSNSFDIVIGPNNYDEVDTGINLGFTSVRGYAVDTPRTHLGTAASRTLRVEENNRVFTNLDATGLIELTLPPDFVTACFQFFVIVTQPMRIRAPANTRIRLGPSTATSLGGYIEAGVIGSSVTLQCVAVDTWYASTVVGTWTVV